jgi:hypothetical protein
MRYSEGVSLYVDGAFVQKVRLDDSYTINVSAKSTTVTSHRPLDGYVQTDVYPTTDVSLIDLKKRKSMAKGSTSFVSAGSISATQFRHASNTAFDAVFDDDDDDGDDDGDDDDDHTTPPRKQWSVVIPTDLPLIGEEN